MFLFLNNKWLNRMDKYNKRNMNNKHTYINIDIDKDVNIR